MIEASRVQKLLNEQNAEIDRLKERNAMLSAALRWICGSRTVEYLDGTCSIDETKMLWTYRRIARETLEGIYDERIFKDPT